MQFILIRFQLTGLIIVMIGQLASAQAVFNDTLLFNADRSHLNWATLVKLTEISESISERSGAWNIIVSEQNPSYPELGFKNRLNVKRTNMCRDFLIAKGVDSTLIHIVQSVKPIAHPSETRINIMVASENSGTLASLSSSAN